MPCAEDGADPPDESGIVRAAERTADAAYYQYEADLADFVLQVIVAYWAVVGRREAVEARREALELCQMVFTNNPGSSGRSPPTGDLRFVPLAACAYEANELSLARELALRGREEYRRYGLQHRGLIAPDQVLIMASAGLGAPSSENRSRRSTSRIVRRTRSAESSRSGIS